MQQQHALTLVPPTRPPPQQAAPTTAPSALATLAADPHAPADLCESPTAWAGLLHCLPAVLSDAVTSEAAASLVAAVAATAAVENPPLLPDLAWAAVGGLEAGSAGATPPAAVACATTLLAHTLPRAWATFTPPVLGAAARALGRAVARDTTTTSPSAALLALSSTSASPTWLRRWAATPRVATVLWGVLGPEQVGLHARALVEGGGGALAVSATLVSAALATQAGRACVAHSDAPAAVLALAQLCGSADAGVSDTARVSCTALAACDGAPSLLPRPALLALVENEVTPALAALARTPRGADALLAAVNEGEAWPKAGAAALPPAVAAAVGSDQLGALHLTAHPAPGALAAAAASRSTPAGLAALTQAGLDPVMLADAWLKTASSWVPPGPPSPAWAVCAAAVALAALRPAAMAASVEAAVAGVAPTFEGPPVPPPPPAEEVAAVHDALGAAVARLLSE